MTFKSTLQLPATTQAHPVVPVGISLLDAWAERYPHGEIAQSLRMVRQQMPISLSEARARRERQEEARLEAMIIGRWTNV